MRNSSYNFHTVYLIKGKMERFFSRFRNKISNTFTISIDLFTILSNFPLVSVQRKMPSLKRSSSNTIDGIPNDAHKTKKNAKDQLEITDLNDDCLEHIFKFFDLPNLFIVADTCKRFREVTKTIYKCRQLTSVKIDILSRSSIDELKLLRIFGDVIQKLSINFYLLNCNKRNNIAQQFEECIFKYCSQSKSLKELELVCCPKYLFESIEKPFKSVEIVRFSEGFLGEKISQFNWYFPKMRSLEIYYMSEVVNPSCIETKFPLLEHLNIENTSSFSTQNIKTAISLNTQLRSIHSFCKYYV